MSTEKTRYLGVHCSIRGGVMTALKEADELQCNALQIFTQSPRMWRRGRLSDSDTDAFKQSFQARKMGPLVVHTPYLPNLCTSNEELYVKSCQALEDDLYDCGRLGAAYLVIHPGSYSEDQTPEVGIARLQSAINRAFERFPNNVMILIENMAGGGRRMAGSFEQIRTMMDGIHPSERIGLCLDTAHTLAAGYPLNSPDGVAQTLADVERHIGLNRLRVIHLNDSKAPQGSRRDLHQHIGQGFVGLDAFRALLQDARLDHAVLILETPKDSPEDDPRNLAAVRQLDSVTSLIP